MISAHERLHDCVEVSRRHGLGRIEVANLAQLGVAKFYLAPQRIVLADALVRRKPRQEWVTDGPN